MRHFHCVKVFYICVCFLLIACGDIPKEGSEQVEVKVKLEYDNGTKRLGPLLEYIKLEY